MSSSPRKPGTPGSKPFLSVWYETYASIHSTASAYRAPPPPPAVAQSRSCGGVARGDAPAAEVQRFVAVRFGRVGIRVGDEMSSRGRFAPPLAQSRSTIVARTEGYTYDAKSWACASFKGHFQSPRAKPYSSDSQLSHRGTAAAGGRGRERESVQDVKAANRNIRVWHGATEMALERTQRPRFRVVRAAPSTRYNSGAGNPGGVSSSRPKESPTRRSDSCAHLRA
jgi:hypothetical protein